MKLRNIEPNNVIKIIGLEEVNGKAKAIFINEVGVEKESNLILENLKTKKMEPATLKDWQAYMNMLSETAVADSKLKELELQFGKEIDAQIATITSKFATEPENAAALGAELAQITSTKTQIIQTMIEEETDKIRKDASERKNFFVGGIMRFDGEKGTSRALEIPQPSKKARNMRNISNYAASINYSYTYEGKPLLAGNITKDLDLSKVVIRTTVAHTNNDNIIDKIFNINNNTINGLSGAKGEMLYTKLLTVFGKSEEAKSLYEFKKENKFEDLNPEKIETLKVLFNDIKKDILTNGMKEYNIGINVYYDPKEKARLLERMVKGIENGVVQKLTGTNKLPESIELTNINGVHKIPTNTVKGVDIADQWYAAISTKDGKITNISAPIDSKNNEEFVSSTIEEQIRDFVAKSIELENSIER